MKKSILFLSLFFLSNFLFAQSYTSYFTGSTEDSQATPTFGIVLMGGAGENDEAMKWFLERANGGDVVVIRASGSDGYNDYLFSELGITVNSVESIVFNDAGAAEDPYVIEQVQNAEAIWMAGGDQWDYVSYWKGTAIEDAINTLLNDTGGPVGGISAGMAVMGGTYFNAAQGTVSSFNALANPYSLDVQLGHDDFIEAPYMENVVTDTHYDDPDRKGRHVTFMARMATDYDKVPKGIACDEYAAVCIDSDGMATCYGEGPEFDDYIYFVRPNCTGEVNPQVCETNVPLTWNEGNEALKVLRINGNIDGDYSMDLNNWINHTGGEWFDWYVEEGELFEVPGEAPDCALSVANLATEDFDVWPIPATHWLNFNSKNGSEITLYNLQGTILYQGVAKEGLNQLDLDGFESGVYLLENGGVAKRVLKL